MSDSGHTLSGGRPTYQWLLEQMLCVNEHGVWLIDTGRGFAVVPRHLWPSCKYLFRNPRVIKGEDLT